MKKKFTVNASLTNYGGAFDIDPYSFWTRDDIVDLADSVCDQLLVIYPDAVINVTDCYLDDDYKTIVCEFSIDEYQYTAKVVPDMRKIKKPSDLTEKYTQLYVNQVVSQHDDTLRDISSVQSSSDVEADDDADNIVEQLKSQVYSEGRKVMTSPSFGFLDDEVDNYFFVDVEHVDPNTIRVEVRAEVSYDGMMELSDVLDPIVESFDSDAYFDFDDAGIMSAYINVSAM